MESKIPDFTNGKKQVKKNYCTQKFNAAIGGIFCAYIPCA